MKDQSIPPELPLTIQALIMAKETKLSMGSIECPKCKGVLSFRKAKNDHTAGKCNTENCLSWRE